MSAASKLLTAAAPRVPSDLHVTSFGQSRARRAQGTASPPRGLKGDATIPLLLGRLDREAATKAKPFYAADAVPSARASAVDLLRLYVRETAARGRLTREEEVNLARTMDTTRTELFERLIALPGAVERLIERFESQSKTPKRDFVWSWDLTSDDSLENNAEGEPIDEGHALSESENTDPQISEVPARKTTIKKSRTITDACLRPFHETSRRIVAELKTLHAMQRAYYAQGGCFDDRPFAVEERRVAGIIFSTLRLKDKSAYDIVDALSPGDRLKSARQWLELAMEAGIDRRVFIDHYVGHESDERWVELIKNSPKAHIVPHFDARLAALRDAHRGAGSALGIDAASALPRLRQVQELSRHLQRLTREMFEHNALLVVSMAKVYKDSGIPLLDLVQEANFDLMRAVEKFNWRLGYEFSTYASRWIGVALSEAATVDRTIHVSLDTHKKAQALDRVVRELTQRYGRAPSADEIAAEATMKVDDVRKLQAVVKPLKSLDMPLRPGSDDPTTLASRLEDVDQPTAIETTFANERRRMVERALREILTPREERVVRQFFGIGSGHDLTYDEIGKMDAVSRQRIEQINKGALAKIINSRFRPVLALYGFGE